MLKVCSDEFGEDAHHIVGHETSLQSRLEPAGLRTIGVEQALLDERPDRLLAARGQRVQTQLPVDPSGEHDPFDLPGLNVEDLAADRRGLPCEQPVGPGTRVLGIPEPDSPDV